MHAILFFLALLPWANAQSTSASQNFTVPISSPSVALQSPGNLTSCETANIAWVASNFAGTRIPFTINYTNQGAGDTVTKVISGVAIVVTDPSVQVAIWRVNVPTSGHYILTGSAGGVTILPSDPFIIVVSDTSCYNSTTTASTPTRTPASGITTASSVPLGASTTSLAAIDPSKVPVGSNRNNSKVATMVGATLGSVIFVALLAAIFFYCRHRSRESLKTRTYANSKPEKPKGHRKWGGLSSVDSSLVLEGIHTLTHPKLAHTNSRSGSVKDYDDAFEKRKTPVIEEERFADEMATPSPRSGMLSATFAQQDSGLAAFNNERARTASSSPAVSLMEDPLFDNMPHVRGKRSKSFSILSTAQPSPRSSNTRTPSAISTLEGSVGPLTSESSGPESTMRRSKSATAGTRPVRKPVPHYDASIEMTTTTPAYSHHSAQNSVTNFTSDSHTVLGSSVNSTCPLLSRGPSVNRNIGLAFQGDGPVHYLTVDMPPPPRD
jgi:hypothetical protein